jgi:hypothetical protein
VSEAYESLPIFRDPRFDAMRNSVYHTERAAFLDKLNKAVNSLVIILGASAFSDVAKRWAFDEKYIQFALLLMATIQLIFDFGGSAKDHRFQQTRYSEALADMEKIPVWDDEAERTCSARLVTIGGDEVQTMRALDAVAFNQALDALHGGTPAQVNYRLHIGWFHYAFKQIFAFSRTQFMPETQRRPLFARLCEYFRVRGAPKQRHGV